MSSDTAQRMAHFPCGHVAHYLSPVPTIPPATQAKEIIFIDFVNSRGHNAAVLCVQFDDRKIVSGSYDKTIKVLNMS